MVSLCYQETTFTLFLKLPAIINKSGGARLKQLYILCCCPTTASGTIIVSTSYTTVLLFLYCFTFIFAAHEVGEGNIAITMSDRASIRPRFVSGRYLRSHQPDCFYIACTHPLEGADMPIEGYYLRPIFLPSIL